MRISLKSAPELGGCLIDWKGLSTWKAAQKFCSLVVSWSIGVHGMSQNLEHAQKLVPSPDLTQPFFYLPEAAQWMPPT